MNFSATNKRKFIITLALSVIISLCFFAIAMCSTLARVSGQELSVADKHGQYHNSVQLVADEDYSIRIADRVISEISSYEFDKDVYSYDNLMFNFNNSFIEGKSFICPSAPQSVSQANVVYNVKAPAGQPFSFLQLTISGRVDHYINPEGVGFYPQHGTGEETSCDDCYMIVYVSETDDFTDAASKVYNAGTVGFTAREMNLIEVDPDLLGKE